MRTFTLIALIGLSAALELKAGTKVETQKDLAQIAAKQEGTEDWDGDEGEGSGDEGEGSGDEGEGSGDESGDEDDSAGIDDIYYALFQMYDLDGSGTISRDEFTTASETMVTELEANGYYNDSWSAVAADADWIFDQLDAEYWDEQDESGNWDWGYDYDDQVDYETFVEGIDWIAWEYGLSEWELGFLMLGLADHNGDWYVTEAELIDWAHQVGLDADDDDMAEWFDEVYQGEEDWEGEPAIQIWTFCSWWHAEEYYAQRDLPSTREWLEIAFDTMDTDDDGEISYFDVVDYVKHYYDVQADEGKIERHWVSDEDIERDVRYVMEDLAERTVPVVSRDQALYAYTVEDPVDSWIVGDVLTDIFMTDYENDGVQRSDLDSQANLYDLDVAGDDLKDLFDRMDVDDDGVIDGDELWGWVDSQAVYDDCETSTTGCW